MNYDDAVFVQALRKRSTPTHDLKAVTYTDVREAFWAAAPELERTPEADKWIDDHAISLLIPHPEFILDEDGVLED